MTTKYRRKPVKHSVVNPAGAKMLRAWAKFKLGGRRTYAEALAWYSGLKDGDRS